MTALGIILGWLHIVFTAAFVGGGLFNLFILSPLLKDIDPKSAGMISSGVGAKFTSVVWISLAGLYLTGLVKILTESSLAVAFDMNSSYGMTMIIKGILVLAITGIAVLITKTAAEIPKASSPEMRGAIKKKVHNLAVTNNMLGFLVIFFGVVLRYGGVLF